MPDQPRPVYRLHIKPATIDRAASIEYCKSRKVISVGWPVGGAPKTWPAYVKAADREYEQPGGNYRGAVQLHDLPNGALVWVRDLSGKYWIAEVIGEWRYDGSRRARELEVANQRPVRWRWSGNEADVPGGLLRYYGGRTSTLTPIRDEGVQLFTNMLVGLPVEAPSLKEVIRGWLSPFDVEDLISLYFQREKGYVVYLPPTKRTTPAYEFMMRNPRTGADAVVQVKSGSQSPEFDTLRPHLETGEVWYYTSEPIKAPRGGFKALSLADLERFCHTQKHLLPGRLQTWVDRTESK